MKIKSYSKIILVLFLAFFVSDFLGKNIFLSYSPKLRSNLIANFSNDFTDKKNKLISSLNPSNLFKNINLNSMIAVNKNEQVSKEQVYDYLIKNLKPVGKGVEASTYKNYAYSKVNFDEIEWVETELVKMDGTKMKIRVPKRY